MIKQISVVIATLLVVLMVISSASAVVTITNGIYNVSVAEENDDNPGMYTVATGDNNPEPNENVLYGGVDQDPYSTYLTVRDETDDDSGMVEYTSRSGRDASAGYTQRDLEDYNPAVTTVSPTQVDTTWTVNDDAGAPLFSILQSISILGTTIDDSMVEVSTIITNLDDVTRQFSIRYYWDIQISDNDGAQVRTVNPTGSWLINEASWTDPTFDSWEATDNPSSPTFSIFGSNLEPDLSTPPDVLSVAEYDDSSDAAFDYTINPALVIEDSAVLYYWNDIILAAGLNSTVNAYLFINPEGPTPTPTPTPTPSPTPSTTGSNVSASTVPMQTTGSPLGLFLVGIIIATGGAIYSRKYI